MSDIRSSMSSIPADRWELAFGKKEVGQVVLEQFIKHMADEVNKRLDSSEPETQEC